LFDVLKLCEDNKAASGTNGSIGLSDFIMKTYIASAILALQARKRNHTALIVNEVPFFKNINAAWRFNFEQSKHTAPDSLAWTPLDVHKHCEDNTAASGTNAPTCFSNIS